MLVSRNVGDFRLGSFIIVYNSHLNFILKGLLDESFLLMWITDATFDEKKIYEKGHESKLKGNLFVHDEVRNYKKMRNSSSKINDVDNLTL